MFTPAPDELVRDTRDPAELGEHLLSEVKRTKRSILDIADEADKQYATLQRAGSYVRERHEQKMRIQEYARAYHEEQARLAELYPKPDPDRYMPLDN